MEQLMLRYTLDQKGANAYPLHITRDEMLRSLPVWLQNTGQNAIDPNALSQFLGYPQSLSITKDELLNSVPAWVKKTNQKIVDLSVLMRFLGYHQRFYRFAPGWIRLCSAVSRHDHYAKHYQDTSLITNAEFANLIFEGAKEWPEAKKWLVGPVFHTNATNVLEQIMKYDRAILLEFTRPEVLLDNLIAHDLYHASSQTFDRKQEYDIQACANRMLKLHQFDESCPVEACEAICKMMELRPAAYHQALPLWLKNIVLHAKSETENGMSVKGMEKERLQYLVEWSKEQPHSVLEGHEVEAVRILIELAVDNPGIFDG
jgi:hypothetical protein